MNKYIEIITGLFKGLWNKLDLSLGYVVKTFKWLQSNSIYAIIAGTLVLIVCGYRYWFKRCKQDRTNLTSVARHLIVSSANHLQSAISIMSKQPLIAYEKAIQASIEATTAQNITDDKSKFSSELGVDIFKYLEYTNGIVNQLKQKLQS